MITFYLVRHCITAWNLEHRMQGSTNEPLCPLGEAQLPYLTEYFRNIPVDTVFSSMSERAVQTAKAIASPHNTIIVLDDALRERGAGDFEGKTVRELLELTGAEVNVGGPRYPGRFDFPTGEPIREVYERISRVLKHIAENFSGNVAVVSHGMALQMAFAWLTRTPLEEYVSLPIHNGSVSKAVVPDNGPPVLEYVGDEHFYPRDFMELGSRIERT